MQLTSEILTSTLFTITRRWLHFESASFCFALYATTISLLSFGVPASDNKPFCEVLFFEEYLELCNNLPKR